MSLFEGKFLERARRGAEYGYKNLERLMLENLAAGGFQLRDPADGRLVRPDLHFAFVTDAVDWRIANIPHHLEVVPGTYRV